MNCEENFLDMQIECSEIKKRIMTTEADDRILDLIYRMLEKLKRLDIEK